jgi:transposase-like protein
MEKTRQRRSAQFKSQIALEALKEQKTLSRLASEVQRASDPDFLMEASLEGWHELVRATAGAGLARARRVGSRILRADRSGGRPRVGQLRSVPQHRATAPEHGYHTSSRV